MRRCLLSRWFSQQVHIFGSFFFFQSLSSVCWFPPASCAAFQEVKHCSDVHHSIQDPSRSSTYPFHRKKQNPVLTTTYSIDNLPASGSTLSPGSEFSASTRATIACFHELTSIPKARTQQFATQTIQLWQSQLLFEFICT